MRKRRGFLGAAALCTLLGAGLFWGEAGAYSADTFLAGWVEEQNSTVGKENRADGERREDGGGDNWELILVNPWNPIPEQYEITLTQLQNDQSVDSRIYPELQQMFDDARAEGLLPMISSSYRTEEMQRQMMAEKVEEYEAQGYTAQEAEKEAKRWVAQPGTSEHQVGLAVDITTADWSRQDASVIWEWLNENSYKYGFILRYTQEKEEITGVAGEPWHYRYVGKETAARIYGSGLCLEEYLEELS